MWAENLCCLIPVVFIFKEVLEVLNQIEGLFEIYLFC